MSWSADAIRPPLGKGSFHTDLLVDFSPGGSCNIVAESDVFAANNGAIFAQSHHEDCATFGLRIDTTFQVTGAAEPSRARAGAAGSLARTRAVGSTTVAGGRSPATSRRDDLRVPGNGARAHTWSKVPQPGALRP